MNSVPTSSNNTTIIIVAVVLGLAAIGGYIAFSQMAKGKINTGNSNLDIESVGAGYFITGE